MGERVVETQWDPQLLNSPAGKELRNSLHLPQSSGEAAATLCAVGSFRLQSGCSEGWWRMGLAAGTASLEGVLAPALNLWLTLREVTLSGPRFSPL